MNRHILVPLLKPVVFPDIMQVVTADHDRPHHLHFLHYSGQDPATNGDIAGERTLLVNVGAFNRLTNNNQ